MAGNWVKSAIRGVIIIIFCFYFRREDCSVFSLRGIEILLWFRDVDLIYWNSIEWDIMQSITYGVIILAVLYVRDCEWSNDSHEYPYQSYFYKQSIALYTIEENLYLNQIITYIIYTYRYKSLFTDNRRVNIRFENGIVVLRVLYILTSRLLYTDISYALVFTSVATGQQNTRNYHQLYKLSIL